MAGSVRQLHGHASGGMGFAAYGGERITAIDA
jgi:hypothetical protein